MNKCLNCSRDTTNPKFCGRSCAAKYNNRKFPKRTRSGLYNCVVCDTGLTWRQKKYCSNACQALEKHNLAIKEWKEGKRSAINSQGIVRGYVRKYLKEKYENKCCLCGWNKVNPYTKKVPLVIDHMDGNCDNNSEDNLRVICWNCDALGPTFRTLNKGNGRSVRGYERVVYVKAPMV